MPLHAARHENITRDAGVAQWLVDSIGAKSMTNGWCHVEAAKDARSK